MGWYVLKRSSQIDDKTLTASTTIRAGNSLDPHVGAFAEQIQNKQRPQVLARADFLGSRVEDGIIGYETDAADYVRDPEGYPVPTGKNGTPPTLSILATSDLPNWRDRPGTATMVMFERGAGIVITAGTTGWGQGLKRCRGHVHRITRNLVQRLVFAKYE